jgi:sigma-E factor negative regulatory protein RseA
MWACSKVLDMTENMRESLSALMDGEANELELERVLKQAVTDEAVRETWMRYNLARHSASGHAVAHLDWDISKQVRTALSETQEGDAQRAQSGLKQRVMRPVASFAVAASVAATVVIGGQQLAQIGGAGSYDRDRAVAISSSPVGMVNTLGATTVQASYGMRAIPVLQPMTRTAYRDLAQQRLGKYSQEHAEQAALNSPQGLISYARVPRIRE